MEKIPQGIPNEPSPEKEPREATQEEMQEMISQIPALEDMLRERKEKLSYLIDSEEKKHWRLKLTSSIKKLMLEKK